MKTEGKTLLASCLLHLAVVGSAASFGAFTHKPQVPIFVDFTMEQGASGNQRAPQGDSGAQQSPVPQAKSPLPLSAPVAAAPREPPVVPAIPAAVAAESALTRAAPPVAAAPSAAGTASGQPGGISTNDQGGTSGPGKTSPGTGNGLHGDSAESRQTQYLKEHFTYIRNTIAANLRYPSKARKMGWNGKLAIEFVILESGTVDKIRVTRSSGIPLLDSDAEETVRRSAPFPKPPVSARLVIPVEYVLK